MGSSSGVDEFHEHNELPPSAEATAVSSRFNLYRWAAARGQWEALALGHVDARGGASASSSQSGGSRSRSGSKAQQQQQQVQPQQLQERGWERYSQREKVSRRSGD
jgi:hypothetical protein